MKGLRSLVLVGVAAASIAFGMLPASADSGVAAGAFVGTGGIAPGLSSGGGFQNYTLTGNGAIAGVDTTHPGPVVGTVSCNLSGTDTIGTPQAGAGAVNGGCTVSNVTPAGGENCAFSGGSYNRTAVLVTASAGVTCTGTVPVAGSLTAVCVFVPLSAPPITSFAVICAFAISG